MSRPDIDVEDIFFLQEVLRYHNSGRTYGYDVDVDYHGDKIPRRIVTVKFNGFDSYFEIFAVPVVKDSKDIEYRVSHNSDLQVFKDLKSCIYHINEILVSKALSSMLNRAYKSKKDDD